MEIKQPKWKTPEYSKGEINQAGNIMRNPNATEQEKQQSIKVIDNWRSAHAYPLHVFYINLRDMKGSRKDIIVAQRLKRLESILKKLEIQPDMELWRMHDLGGCRMVVPTLDEVYKYSNRLRHSRIRHEFKREYDYIKQPKESGYRSLHLVYKFHSDKASKEAYNKNMLIELQFRTHLQHIWATALETLGLFTHQALKSGQGSDEILRFFKLVSSLFALRENSPTVPGTSSSEKDLIDEIKEINLRTHVIDMLKGIRIAIDHESQRIADKKGYYLLVLNYDLKRIRVRYYLPSQNEQANAEYETIEKNIQGKPIDAVLVRASSMDDVRSAYPNYFMDIGEFVNIVLEYTK